jgi:glyoxylase-like metal-dependent hydrolase (beta-lactamase superfamily II)
VTSNSKQPQVVFDGIYAFPPNRQTLGGTAYLIVENHGSILVDCPAWHLDVLNWLGQFPPVQWLVITHRGGMADVAQIQSALGCQVLVQEQEAYLLPGISLKTWQHQIQLEIASKLESTLEPEYHLQLIWTPGHSPGSACVYRPQGGILFSGRHLLPNPQGQPMPLRTAKTFHWPRQLQSVQRLLGHFNPQTLHYLCPGANSGYLRGRYYVEQAYQHLSALNLEALLQAPPQ